VTVNSRNDLVTYFINKSHPDPNEIFVRPRRSFALHFFNNLITVLNSCSNCIQVVLVLLLITDINVFIAETGTATSFNTNSLNSIRYSCSLVDYIDMGENRSESEELQKLKQKPQGNQLCM
jgi:hypothetical protein